MKKKRFVLITLFSVLLLLLAACGGDTAEPTEAPVEPTEAPVEEPVEEEPTEEPMEEPTEEPMEEEPTEEPMEEEEPTEEPMEEEEPTAEAEEEDPSAEDLGTEDNPIVMSFVPSGDTQDIIVSGDQLADMISESTGLEIVANVGTDFAAVREAMGAEQAHIGWLNTFNYILANETYGVEVALVTERFGLSYYNGQIIVNADAGIESIADLEGKVMCWVDPNSTSGYIIPRITIAAEGVDPDTDFAETLEAGSHDNVVIQVYNGECDAGATFVDARTNVEEDFPDVNERVQVLTTTSDIPNDSVSFIPEFPEDMRQEIVDALLEIAETPEGQEALNTLYSIEGLQEADDSFYDEFRLDLSRAGIDIEELAGGG